MLEATTAGAPPRGADGDVGFVAFEVVNAITGGGNGAEDPREIAEALLRAMDDLLALNFSAAVRLHVGEAAPDPGTARFATMMRAMRRRLQAPSLDALVDALQAHDFRLGIRVRTAVAQGRQKVQEGCSIASLLLGEDDEDASIFNLNHMTGEPLPE